LKAVTVEGCNPLRAVTVEGCGKTVWETNQRGRIISELSVGLNGLWYFARLLRLCFQGPVYHSPQRQGTMDVQQFERPAFQICGINSPMPDHTFSILFFHFHFSISIFSFLFFHFRFFPPLFISGQLPFSPHLLTQRTNDQLPIGFFFLNCTCSFTLVR
jgi:hypothetical protein